MQLLRSYIVLFCYTAAISGFLSACHHSLAPFASPVINQPATDNSGHPALLGACDPEKLAQPPFDNWFVKNYDNYHPDTPTALLLKETCKNKKFVIFMGTWCGDSQREVPRMLRLLRFCEVPSTSIRVIMVSDADSTYKQSPAHQEKGLHIIRVPDLIVFEKNREIGRIIESPITSIEKDLLAISSHQPYQPHYYTSLQLARRFEKESPDKVRANLPALADSLRPNLKSPGELYSLAHVFRSTGQPEWAAIVQRLNTLLFPAPNHQ